MSEFSSVFSRHVHRKNIKTYALAQYCGFDRSNMYKIINGKRSPSSGEMVQKISKFMQLSPAEEKELEEAYQITIAGYDNYYRRKDVLNFFSGFNLTAPSLPSLKYSADYMSDKETYLLSSPSEIEQALFHMISTEMNTCHNGRIRLLIQPDASFLINLICAKSRIDTTVHIEHIICLNNNTETVHAQKNYNLNCLKQILPLYGACRNYECFYYYDDVSAKTRELTLFPYMVITSQYVCLLTADLGRGYIMRSHSSHEMFSGIFSDYLRKSRSLLHHEDTLTDQFTYAESILNESTAGYCFQMTPCFTPFLTKSHIEKYTKKETAGRSSFIIRFQEYSHKMAAGSENPQMIYIFSLEGVRRFLNTGKIYEYAADLCMPFNLHDRIQLIERLIAACSDSRYRMLKNSIGSPDHGLYLFTNKQTGYLMFSSPYSGRPVYLNIEEPGLLFTFYDFCENLDDHMFYTEEETIELLNNLIRIF